MLNKTFSAFPILVTERLTLRQPLESDAPDIFLLRSDKVVNQYLNRKPTETLEEAISFIGKVNVNFEKNESFYWAITETNNDKLIGTICLFDLSDELNKCEIGYELLPGNQGQGIMCEALQAIIQFTFETLELDTIDAFTHKDNKSSTKLLLKFGFEETEYVDENHPNLILFRLSN